VDEFFKGFNGELKINYHDRWEFDLAKKEFLIELDVAGKLVGSVRF